MLEAPNGARPHGVFFGQQGLFLNQKMKISINTKNITDILALGSLVEARAVLSPENLNSPNFDCFDVLTTGISELVE